MFPVAQRTCPSDSLKASHLKYGSRVCSTDGAGNSIGPLPFFNVSHYVGLFHYMKLAIK